jgi:deoxynucleoside triphosphate triphosphohydrolase SAMHD1
MFDGEFIPRSRIGIEWTHEMGSEMLFDHLIDDNQIEMAIEDRRLIKALISGESNRVPQEKKFLFDIVANKRSGVDVDKFDYLERDSWAVNLNIYDSQRLTLFSKVIGHEICYPHKLEKEVNKLFNARYTLFQEVYTHKVSKAIEYMIVDAMLYADPVLQISSQIDDPVLYTNLHDDVIFTLIERSTDPQLEKSREILARLKKRDLYKFVDEFTLLPEIKLTSENVTAAAILSYHPNKNDVTVFINLLISVSVSDLIIDLYVGR